MLTLSMHDRIQRLIAEKEPQEHWWIRHKRSTFDKQKMLQATTTDFKGDIKLHGYFGFLHEEPWLHNNEMVCEKVELYDYKWSALREATRYFILNMTVYIAFFTGTSNNHVPLL